MTKPDPLARFTLLVLLPNRGLRWVRQSPRVTSQQLESTVRLLFQIFGPTNENGNPDPNNNPAGLGGIEGMRAHIHDVPDAQGRSFEPTSVLFLLHVVTAFVCNVALLRVRDPRSVRSRRSARLHWHWVQLLFFLGIPAECHVGETEDGRCGVSTARHPPPPGTACPGCQICRTRIIITNLHRAEAMARKRNCSAAQIALITGSLFIQLFTALAATVPAGAKLVMQITAGAVARAADTTHPLRTLHATAAGDSDLAVFMLQRGPLRPLQASTRTSTSATPTSRGSGSCSSSSPRRSFTSSRGVLASAPAHCTTD